MNSDATHITDDEKSYLLLLQQPVNLFGEFLRHKYGPDVVSVDAATGAITRAVRTAEGLLA